MIFTRWQWCTLVVMAAYEVICTLAATLWIGFVVAVLAIGCRVMAKLRSKRRRVTRLLDVVRSPLWLGSRGQLRWRDRVLRYYGVRPSRQRPGLARHYSDIHVLFQRIEPGRLIARLAAEAVRR